MDAALKELEKLEKLSSNSRSAKGKAPCIADSLDSLLRSLRETKERVQSGAATEETLSGLSGVIESTKKDIDDRQKEIYNSLARYGKALDKKFPAPLPSYPKLFSSPDAIAALERTIALHFLRTGQSTIAETFIDETGVDISSEMRMHFSGLHRIISALHQQDITPALEWTEDHREFLASRNSPLEFCLHRSQYLRLLFSSSPSDVSAARSYASANILRFYGQYEKEINRLMGCMIYLRHFQASPYADLASPAVHLDLEPMFAKEYCASLGMSRQVPLRVVGDIGGGGALARIEKGRKVMRERRSEWSQSDELLIEIPLSADNRYHSIFACPVSKEQSTEQNPPMMLGCGHVITDDSLRKLSKPSGRVKCPYCPAESDTSLRVHF